jgi:hypothetical protein
VTVLTSKFQYLLAIDRSAESPDTSEISKIVEPKRAEMKADLKTSIPNNTVDKVEISTQGSRSDPNWSTAPSISDRTNNSLTAKFRSSLAEKPLASLLRETFPTSLTDHLLNRSTSFKTPAMLMFRLQDYN